MKLWFLRAAFWFWFITRGYYLWSKFWWLILERKYKHQALTEYANIGQLESALSKMKWTEDWLSGIFDRISRPQKVEAIYRAAKGDESKATVGDCDEFAIYAATCIKQLIRDNKGSYETPYFMSINWLDKDGKFHGHNICAFFDKNLNHWCHVGNWFDGRVQCGFDNLQDIAQWFANNDRDKPGVLIAWAAATPELKLKELRLG